MEWHNVQSLELPEETDTTSSKVYNFVRRNITAHESEQDGETIVTYEYQECKIPKESWGMYLELIQTKADVAYLNMITEDL